MELFLIKLVKKLWTAYHIWATLFQNFEWDTIYQTLGYGQILVLLQSRRYFYGRVVY